MGEEGKVTNRWNGVDQSSPKFSERIMKSLDKILNKPGLRGTIIRYNYDINNHPHTTMIHERMKVILGYYVATPDAEKFGRIDFHKNAQLCKIQKKIQQKHRNFEGIGTWSAEDELELEEKQQ